MSDVIKLPPQAPEVEEALLGYLLLNGAIIEEIIAILPSGEMFYIDAHRKVYQAILDYYRQGYGYADAVLLMEWLTKRGQLESIGGYQFLMALMDANTNCNYMQYAIIVREKYMLRQLISIAGEVMNKAYDESANDVFDLVDSTSQKLDNIINFKIANNVKPLADIAIKSLKEIAERRAEGKTITGISSGYSSLDKLTGGWQKKELVYIAARPSVGKTAVLLNFCLNASTNDEPANVLIFSMEMSDTKIFNRILSRMSGVSLQKISKEPNTITDDEWNAMQSVATRIKDVKIYVDDSTNVDPVYIKSTARRYVKKFGVGLVVVDYLQLMRNTEKKGQNREQEVANISVMLKATAKDLDIPLIALAQLNRDGDDGEPELRNIRESGALEQDGDLIGLLWRPSKKEIEEDPRKDRMLMLSIKKNRDGATGEVPLLFNKETQEIKEWEDFKPVVVMPLPPNHNNKVMNQAFYRNFSEPENTDELPF